MATSTDLQGKEIARTYKNARRSVRRELKALAEGLGRHARVQAAKPGEWGSVGDLLRVAGLLSEINEFLGK